MFSVIVIKLNLYDEGCLAGSEFMGTRGGQLNGVLPWLVRWNHRAGTRDFCPALAALVSPVKIVNFSTFTFSLYTVGA